MSNYLRGAVDPVPSRPKVKRPPTRARIDKVVQRLIKASVEDSWKGGGDPDDWDEIELELKRAKRAYEKLLEEFK
jgi:hypothetical protein